METRTYEIRVRGHLDERRLSAFADLTVAHTADGDTLIGGPPMDQAALHALLSRTRDLGIELLAVRVVEPHASSGDT